MSKVAVDRLAMAIVVLGEHLDPENLKLDRAACVDAVRTGIINGDPDIAPMVAALSAVVSIMVDGPLEAHVREAIRLVAAQNKGKLIQMTVPDGPGKGDWEMIIRRVPTPKPSGLILPPGARLQ